MANVFGIDLADFAERDRVENAMTLLERLRGRGDQLVEWNVLLEAQREVEASGGSRDEANLAGNLVSAAWNWLRAQGLIARSPEWSSGQESLTPSGKTVEISEFLSQSRVTQLLADMAVDTELGREVLPLFRRGDYELAVFAAMRLVEVRVREADPSLTSLLGIGLMKEAFKETGPLADPARDSAEQQSYMALFWGAIGVFKNPHSHRVIDIDDPQEAAEAVLLANNLLRMVDRELSRLTSSSPGP